jgi:hypothetical protein
LAFSLPRLIAPVKPKPATSQAGFEVLIGFNTDIFVLLQATGRSVNTSEIMRFDEAAWRVLCIASANTAVQLSACSHDLYGMTFSSDIDAQVSYFPEKYRGFALQIAREWEYASAQERAATQQWNADIGLCSHGVELGCCPAGCGSGLGD